MHYLSVLALAVVCGSVLSTLGFLIFAGMMGAGYFEKTALRGMGVALGAGAYVADRLPCPGAIPRAELPAELDLTPISILPALLLFARACGVSSTLDLIDEPPSGRAFADRV